jgi:hypothetical protein
MDMLLAFILLGDSLVSEFYVPTFRNLRQFHPTKMEETECSDRLAHKIQTSGNHPKERIQCSEHGKSLKSRICLLFICSNICKMFPVLTGLSSGKCINMTWKIIESFYIIKIMC